MRKSLRALGCRGSWVPTSCPDESEPGKVHDEEVFRVTETGKAGAVLLAVTFLLGLPIFFGSRSLELLALAVTAGMLSAGFSVAAMLGS